MTCTSVNLQTKAERLSINVFYSSSEEPSGVKAYFLLRFRANGKFIGKLLDGLGPGNVSAAGNANSNLNYFSVCCQQYIV